MPSYYGQGPYGAGIYSWAPGGARLNLASRSSFAFGAQYIVKAALALRSASSLAIGAHAMWTPIDVPPCEPWALIAACGCPGIQMWPA